jgi:hypothetical protein
VFRARFRLLLAGNKYLGSFIFESTYEKHGKRNKKKRGFDVALKLTLSINDVEVVVACVAYRGV